MPLTSKEMIKLLIANGFKCIRQSGTSHMVMRNDATGVQVTVPMHSRDLKKGLEQAILKQAGLKK